MNSLNLKFTSRKATVKDINFIYELRLKTMKPVFENTLGWNEKTEHEKAADQIVNTSIILVEHKRVGVIKVILKKHELHLHQMQILPDFQKKGIGKALLSQIITRSETLQKPITLYVMKNTPAEKLYRQIGFKVSQDFGNNCEMYRYPMEK